MLKAREILRLKHEVGLSLRGIAQACNCGKTTVSEVLKRAEKSWNNMAYRVKPISN